ncbi:hypothetical protein BDA99DRAFT_534911 [Phascolomyces articulosus]|uniref:Uncharacterized protein n=1 Tax=Phascolomyces articulosus TaxID=60185 RepID=A0AAD5PG66_9FUNG|nr:hypothetical protein BDA99DRAFT_534911 [Phascolomyces articulosus]
MLSLKHFAYNNEKRMIVLQKAQQEAQDAHSTSAKDSPVDHGEPSNTSNIHAATQPAVDHDELSHSSNVDAINNNEATQDEDALIMLEGVDENDDEASSKLHRWIYDLLIRISSSSRFEWYQTLNNVSYHLLQTYDPQKHYAHVCTSLDIKEYTSFLIFNVSLSLSYIINNVEGGMSCYFGPCFSKTKWIGNVKYWQEKHKNNLSELDYFMWMYPIFQVLFRNLDNLKVKTGEITSTPSKITRRYIKEKDDVDSSTSTFDRKIDLIISFNDKDYVLISVEWKKSSASSNTMILQQTKNMRVNKCSCYRLNPSL